MGSVEWFWVKYQAVTLDEGAHKQLGLGWECLSLSMKLQGLFPMSSM